MLYPDLLPAAQTMYGCPYTLHHIAYSTQRVYSCQVGHMRTWGPIIHQVSSHCVCTATQGLAIHGYSQLPEALE